LYGDGTYSDGNPGSIHIPEEAQPENYLSAPVSESVNEIKAVLWENGANALIHSAVGAFVNDGDTNAERAYSNLANNIGLESAEEGQAVAEKIATELGASLIERTASRYSLDPEQLVDFITTCTPQIKNQLLLRTLTVMSRLCRSLLQDIG
jgi:hypothetical protein